MTVTLVLMSLGIFLLIRALPGSYADIELGATAANTAAARSAIDHQLGLNKPFPVQYGLWLTHMVEGRFGTSFASGEPVGQLLGRAFPVTAGLALLAIVFAVVAGVAMGVISALRRDRLEDHGARLLALGGLSIPDFWQATMVILILSKVFSWSPPLSVPSVSNDPLGYFRTLALPALCLGSVLSAQIQRMTRSTMLDVLSADYIRSARARGLPERSITFRHAFRNALPAVVTVAGLQLGFLLGGAVAVEVVFALPGVGQLVLNAVEQRDYPVIQGVLVWVALLYAALNLLVDLIYSVTDPRLGHG